MKRCPGGVGVLAVEQRGDRVRGDGRQHDAVAVMARRDDQPALADRAEHGAVVAGARAQPGDRLGEDELTAAGTAVVASRSRSCTAPAVTSRSARSSWV